MANITLNAEGASFAVKIEGKGKVRRNLAIQHLIAAARFSLRVGEVQAANLGQPYGSFFNEIISYANACVLMSASALEAYVNELYLTPDANFPGMSPAYVTNLWELVESNRSSPLQKFQIALTSRSLPEMPRGAAPFQKATLIFEMRNAITHFKPEWHDEVDAHAKLSTKIANALEPGNSFFWAKRSFHSAG